jgi:hypothetical protein
MGEQKPNGTGQGRFVGIAAIACIVTGCFGLLAALGAFSFEDWTGTGVCLIASAFAFRSILRGRMK